MGHPGWLSARAATAIALVAASLVVLDIGHYIQLDDASGFGSDKWILPLGPVAALLAIAGVLLGVTDRRSRRPLGVTLLVIDAVLIYGLWVDVNLRFVWGRDEGEAQILAFFTALVGLFCLPRRFVRSETVSSAGRATLRLTVWSRLLVYVVITLIGLVVAFDDGTGYADRHWCASTDIDDCDLDGLLGLEWAFWTLIGLVVLFVATEVTLLVVRRRRRS